MKWWISVGLVFLVAGMGACAPAAAPPPAPAPAPVAAPAAPQPSPEDAAWAKVLAEARKESPLMVYTFGFAGETGIRTARAFKDRFNLTVEFVSGRSPAIVERLRTEFRMGQVVASLAEGAGARMMLLKDWGFTDSLRELPVLRQKEVWKGDVYLFDPEAHLLVYTASPSTVIINTRLVKPEEEPRSWYDLLEPKWKGKILTQDPVQGLETYSWYVGMTNNKILPHDFFERFAQQELYFTMGGPADTGRAVAKGERHMAVPGSTRGAIPVIQEGGPIKVLTMKEGFTASPGPFAFLKNAPQPNSAKVFMNWLLSAEGQRLYADTALTYSFRKDVPDAAPSQAQVDWSKGVYLTLNDQKDVDRLWNDKLMVKILKK